MTNFYIYRSYVAGEKLEVGDFLPHPLFLPLSWIGLNQNEDETTNTKWNEGFLWWEKKPDTVVKISNKDVKWLSVLYLCISILLINLVLYWVLLLKILFILNVQDHIHSQTSFYF